MTFEPLPAFEALSLVLCELASPLFLRSMDGFTADADECFTVWLELRNAAAAFEARRSAELAGFERNSLINALALAHELICEEESELISACGCREASMLRWVSRVLAGEEVARAMAALGLAAVAA